MDADQGLLLLGKYSRWQIERYLVLCIGFGIPLAWMLMSVIFIGDTPDFRCAVPENVTVNETIPMVEKDGRLVFDKCSMYANLSIDNRTVPCQYGYWYDPASGYESTLTTQWDLVCGKEWLVELSMIVGHIGSSVGALLFNRLSDVYGRKNIFLICLWTNIPVALIQAFSPHIAVYIALCFFDGLLEQGTIGASFVMAVELFPTEQRTFAGNAMEFFWAFGYISLVLLAYLIRDWRYLMLSITLPLLLTVSFYWFVSESIPWLLANGRTKEANQILKEAARRSKITLPETVFCDTKDEVQLQSSTARNRKEPNDIPKDNPKVVGVADIFQSKVLRKYTLVHFYLWFTVALAYGAINVTVTYLPGDRYFNAFLYSILEIPAYIMVWIFMDKVGRRVPLIFYNFIGGVALLCTVFQTLSTSWNIQPLIITLSMIGNTMTTAAFSVVYIMTPEIYPTNVRNFGVGMCELFARVSGFVSPFARILTRHYAWMPPVIIGIMSIIGGFLTILLPETRHTKLPDSIEEVEQWEEQNT